MRAFNLQLLQVESHPYLTQEKLLRLANHYGINVTAFSPLGALSYVPINMAERHDSVLDIPAIQQIAKTHTKTPAQNILRWGLQRGTTIIPKTTNQDRMRENLAITSFTLSRHRNGNNLGIEQKQAF